MRKIDRRSTRFRWREFGRLVRNMLRHGALTYPEAVMERGAISRIQKARRKQRL